MARNRNAQLVGVALKEFGEDRGTTVAAALSYYLLLSIFPLTLFLVGSMSFFVDRDEVKDKVIEGFNEVIPVRGEGNADIRSGVDGVIDARGSIAIIGIIGLAWSASSFFGALRTAINDAFDVKQHRSFPVQKAMDVGGVIAVGMIFVISILVTFLLQITRATTGMIPLFGEATGFFWGLLAFFIPLAISFVAFTVVYKYVPNTHVDWKPALIGAAIPALLFEITKFGFSFYLSYFGNYEATYGTFGAMIAFLFWAYLTGIYLILGAEVAAEYPRVHRGEHDLPDALKPPGMLDKMRVRWAWIKAKLFGGPEPVEEPSLPQGHPDPTP
ncbi:MAG: YihY/virulence factor BrkB family protein [Dehalococcoidia bacterium]